MTLSTLGGDRQSPSRIGREVRTYTEVTSTNDVAMEAARAGESEGLVVVADVQTAGRGRLGRPWHAPAGTCLLMSVLFRPPEPFAFNAARTTMLCGLALREGVAALAGDPPAFDLQLKWPNDLIVPLHAHAAGWAKLAGMLTEVCLDEGATVAADGDFPAALVVGIGLNVNVTPASLAALGPHATSLLSLRGENVDRLDLLSEVLTAIDRHYAALLRGIDPFPAWRAALAWMGETVEVLGPRESYVGVAEGVDTAGALMLRSTEGRLRAFSAGDVSLRRG